LVLIVDEIHTAWEEDSVMCDGDQGFNNELDSVGVHGDDGTGDGCVCVPWGDEGLA